jgi:hypothetical protein
MPSTPSVGRVLNWQGLHEWWPDKAKEEKGLCLKDPLPQIPQMKLGFHRLWTPVEPTGLRALGMQFFHMKAATSLSLLAPLRMCLLLCSFKVFGEWSAQMPPCPHPRVEDWRWGPRWRESYPSYNVER